MTKVYKEEGTRRKENVEKFSETLISSFDDFRERHKSLSINDDAWKQLANIWKSHADTIIGQAELDWFKSKNEDYKESSEYSGKPAHKDSVFRMGSFVPHGQGPKIGGSSPFGAAPIPGVAAVGPANFVPPSSVKYPQHGVKKRRLQELIPSIFLGANKFSKFQ
jgi:hypothetical protein